MVIRRLMLAPLGVLAIVLAALTPLTEATAATGTGRVAGVVTMPDGAPLDGPVSLSLVIPSVNTNAYRTVTSSAAAGGAYAFESVAVGSYTLVVTYSGSTPGIPVFTWPSAPHPSLGGAIEVTAGTDVDVDVQLVFGGRIAGTLTGEFGALGSATIVAEGAIRGVETQYFQYTLGHSFNVAAGTYTTALMPPGEYILRFAQGYGSPPPARQWITEYSGDSRTFAGAQVVSITAGQTTDYPVQVTGRPIVRGQIVVANADGSTSPAPWFSYATAASDSGPDVSNSTLAADGSYSITGLDAGTYTICFSGPDDLLGSCAAEPVTVGYNETVTGVDGVLGRGGNLIVSATYELNGTQWAMGSKVEVWRVQGTTRTLARSSTLYTQENFNKLEPGDYVVYVDPTGITDSFSTLVFLNAEYWKDARYLNRATVVHVTAGSSERLDFTLDPRDIEVDRIQGNDRFDVGVGVSQTMYPTAESIPAAGVPVVYVANGYNFPDALVAGPAASLSGGVVLLVEPTAIPPAVVRELQRLRPQRIVVAGGPASVSPQVYTQLAAYVDSPADIFRANGIDRYEASRALIRDAFGDTGSEIAIITTGANFPDALSAGPAAASQGAPVILVDGSATSLDAQTRQLLRDLDVQYVYIAGGTGSVHPGIEQSLRSLLGSDHVSRFAGIDRYEVGVLISQEFFESSEFAFIATGQKFPDALTGGPLAAAFGAPLYLSEPGCIPEDVGYDIVDLGARGIVLLGGPGSLSPAVRDLQLC